MNMTVVLLVLLAAWRAQRMRSPRRTGGAPSPCTGT
jgi:hypothetical protein